MSFEFESDRPIYLQIVTEIKNRAVRGQYRPGEQLPSVREMARMMKVNPNTMARAYAELEREGFTYARRGQGSFITDKTERLEREREVLAEAALNRFIADIGALEMDGTQMEKLMRRLQEGMSRD